jgi:hypothetical protein
MSTTTIDFFIYSPVIVVPNIHLQRKNAQVDVLSLEEPLGLALLTFLATLNLPTGNFRARVPGFVTGKPVQAPI